MSPVRETDVDWNPNLPPFFGISDVDIEAFTAICSQKAEPAEFPTSQSIQHNVVIYDGDRIRSELSHDQAASLVQKEWCRCLNQGPGVFVVKRAYNDGTVIDSMTDIFRKIIIEEQASGSSRGDHFGDNVRIWNSFQKSFVTDPEVALDYYSNPLMALAARSWLGPHYQITAQVNIVKPGSAAQSAHRDYHLGFQSNETTARFPAHAQVMSQYLTLQGGIAHSDMPLESGPTLLLPFSHRYPPGYLAFRNPEFVEYFESHRVQLPLEKGDALFFNPALFHGAGANTSSNDRIGNLVQISSAFGRTMESIDYAAIVKGVYPVLLARQKKNNIPESELNDILSAVAEGYSFPTNLDSDPPLDGCAPENMSGLTVRALNSGWPPEHFENELAQLLDRHKP